MFRSRRGVVDENKGRCDSGFSLVVTILAVGNKGLGRGKEPGVM
jgi:hypothetical protein